jgi:hypothetical protein
MAPNHHDAISGAALAQPAAETTGHGHHASAISSHGGVLWRLVGVMGRGRFARMQALEDAIAYRQVRSTWPCDECQAAPPAVRCDDHARDIEMIASYRHSLRMANLDLESAGMPSAGGRSPG